MFIRLNLKQGHYYKVRISYIDHYLILKYLSFYPEDPLLPAIYVFVSVKDNDYYYVMRHEILSIKELGDDELTFELI